VIDSRFQADFIMGWCGSRLLGTGTNRTLASSVVFTAPPEPTRRNLAGRNRDWSFYLRNARIPANIVAHPLDTRVRNTRTQC
jgi:hypothetical protein